MRTVSGTRRALAWAGNTLLAVMLVWTLVPFYWMVVTSLKKDREIYGYEATLIPRQPTLQNYVRLFDKTPFVKYLRNSTIVSVGNTLASLVFATLGAYALARLRFPGRALIARGLVFTYLVPPALLFIPLFAVMSTLRLVDTHHGLILAYLGFSVPFCTWLLMGYFRSVPVELEEAALVDGCSRLGSLADVAAGAGGRRLLLVHAVVERVPVRQRLREQRGGADGHHRPDAVHRRGRLLLGADDGRLVPERAPAPAALSGLPALGGQGTDARWSERVTTRRS
jgi:ABC-type spermidine/putrescine transport system permease subunit II